MMTLKFWLALRRPPQKHPLFQHNLSSRYQGPQSASGAMFMWLFLISAMGFCWSVAFNWLPLVVLMLILFANTLYSLAWVLRVSDSIVREKEEKRYDLVSVLPTGALGANWALCVGELHRNQWFVWLHFFIRLITVIALLTVIVALFITLFFVQVVDGESIMDALNSGALPLTTNSNLVFMLIFAFGLTLSFYIDHVQSVVMSSLFGIYASTHVDNRGDVRLRALSGFLLVQMTTYVLAAGVCLELFPALYVMLGLNSIPAAVGLTALGVLTFYAIREAMIWQVWRVLRDRLNTDALEFDEVVLRAA